MTDINVSKGYKREKFLSWLKEKNLDLFIVENKLARALATKLRDERTNRGDFRRTVELLGEHLAFAFSNFCNFKEIKVKTPLKETNGIEKDKDLAIVPVLRAGLPLADGFSRAMQGVETTIISCWRDDDLNVEVEYCKSPSLKGKTVIILDPMLATGNTILAVREALKGYGEPKRWIVASLFATPLGIKHVANNYPKGTTIATIYLDDEVFEEGYMGVGLNSHGYIVPGLGDAGDRSFGAPATQR